MIISLARMPIDGLRFHHQYQADELDLSVREFGFQEPPRIAGRADRAGADVRLRGEINAQLIAPCDRCLNDVAVPIAIPFDLFYSPRQADDAEASEVELNERDLDFAPFENDQINLDDMVLEQIELDLPSRLLCREDCPGLCPQCGADLNVGTCPCEKPMDPRWQALADLKAGQEKS